MKTLIPVLGLLLGAVQDPAKDMEAREFKGASGKVLLYRLYRPKEPGKHALLLFLHGAGERGSDNAAQLKHGVRAFLQKQRTYPCFVLAPQCPKDQKWVDVDWGAARHATPEKPSEAMGLLLELLAALEKELGYDPKRVYGTGLSMGGYGIWDLLVRKPGLFAAAVPICGGGDETQAEKIAKVPQWVFHGDQDNVVATARSRNMVEALKKAGGQPRYTEFAGVGHGCWDRAYDEIDLWPWLFTQKR